MNITSLILVAVQLAALAGPAASLEPPPPGARAASRTAALAGRGLANTSPNLDPALLPNLYSPFTGSRSALRPSGLPSKGEPRMLILLIDFDDYPARPSDTPEELRERIFGAGGAFPYESLTAYYRRSSYGRLNIRGDVLGWYRAGLRSEVPQTREGRDALIRTALLSFKDLDLSRYDNNGDGQVDYFGVIWAGPTGDWATFWWGCATRFGDPSFALNGVGLGSYSWQAAHKSHEPAGAPFSVRTLIHETGHSLGLPDYYDYQPGTGPDGGLGGFDMMDAAVYDHNCFSKLALGWISPRVAAASAAATLAPSSEAGDCVVVVPAGRLPGFYEEYFLIERRSPGGNDSGLGHEGGFVVWHVDARRSPEGALLYNNQTASHKLLKFMEADGLEQLERGESKRVTAEDFFGPDASFGAGQGPSAALYGGEPGGFVASFGKTGQGSVALTF